MNELNEIGREVTEEVTETVKETDKDVRENAETVGYSSDYYKWQMANAIESGNQIAYDYAKRDYAKAKAEEEARKVR